MKQLVTCKTCKTSYICTPDQDYFNSTTLDDGVCWNCLLVEAEVPPRPEPSLPVGEN